MAFSDVTDVILTIKFLTNGSLEMNGEGSNGDGYESANKITSQSIVERLQ